MIKNIFLNVLILFLVSCATPEPLPPHANNASLYERLGGKSALQAVVDDLITRIAADERINEFFQDSDIPELKVQLVDQLCELSGGPCVYEGRDMVAAHAGMGITQADFDAMVEDLVLTLNTFEIPEQEQKELLAVLAPMAEDMVEE